MYQLISSSQQPKESQNTVIFILQMKELRHREVECLPKIIDLASGGSRWKGLNSRKYRYQWLWGGAWQGHLAEQSPS